MRVAEQNLSMHNDRGTSQTLAPTCHYLCICAHSLHLQFFAHLPCFLSLPMFCRKLTLLVGAPLASRVLRDSRAFPSRRVSFECACILLARLSLVV